MEKNPYNICTLNPNSNCDECKNQGKIDCKLDKKQQKMSMLVVFSSVIIGTYSLFIVGKITDIWWILIFYIIFILLFFFVIETRINCTHCPYYAENKRHLDCPGNNFFPKIWKYNPKPINAYEKIGSLAGFVLMSAIPIFSLLYCLWLLINSNTEIVMIYVVSGILLATILSFLTFYSLFLLTFCSKCINFSCAFNKVPKELVDEYLKRNPVIKNAWETNKRSEGKG